jgi:hypothetical protein
MRRTLLITLTSIALSMFAAASAGAVVIDMGASGRYGVALVPGTRASLGAAGVTTVTAAAPCTDPWLAFDFILQDTGLCYHGGPVIHKSEVFDVSWDPHRLDWQSTRLYMEQFQKNVATGSASSPSHVAEKTSPYALTSQYRDAGGRALYDSLYGGACTDFGQPGGSACKFASAVATGPGHNDLGSDCPVSGFNDFYQFPDGSWGTNVNSYCITDDQIRTEVSTMVNDMGLIGRTQPGYTPLIVLRTPTGVVDCLDAAGTVCSANGASQVQFCSYHAQTSVGGTVVNYVVQPWTATWPTALSTCDDPGIPDWPNPPSVEQLATGAGDRMASPLSQSELNAITDPALNGWYALDGSEMSDNGCQPFPKTLDLVSVGGTAYYLQREFNNAGAIASDPNALKCAPIVNLVPTFVAPSPINAGDIVAFDGSVTNSTLLISQSDYQWSFGDGTVRTGASVVHQFPKGGSYTVTLSVTDRGGYTASVSQQIAVNGAGGQPPPPPPHKSSFRARLALVPQSFKALLRSGISMRVTSNQVAAGLTQITISRKDAKRAHLKTGRSSTVTIGRGTVSGIKNGTVKLRLRLSHDMRKKLGRLRHLKLTVRLSLKGSTGDRATAVAAGSY